MNFHMTKRLFVVAAAVGTLAVLAAVFFVALTVRSVVADPGGPVPSPGHAWSEIEGHGVTGLTHWLDNFGPLEFRVQGASALRVEPHRTSPRIVGGYSGNSAGANYGATISGGGVSGEVNTVGADGGTIGGGKGNLVSGTWSTVGGGQSNTASGSRATVGGGWGNIASGARGTVGGGSNNSAEGGWSTVGGGTDNTASGGTATVGGGWSNTASGLYATVPGGRNNTAQGNYSFAAGRRAKANHDGSFVWADSTNADFTSTTADQFLIRASGGVGIGTTTPTADLHVEGNAVVTGRVGIGTTSPSWPLHVEEPRALGWGAVIHNTDATGWGLKIETANTDEDKWALSVKSGGTTNFRVTNAGNVGIGTITPDALLHVAGEGRFEVVQITGGSDIAEPFDITGADVIEPGMVLTIDPENPGKLSISEKAYDRLVAGIISGAGGMQPGLLMAQSGSVADGEYPVALTGRVYCWADASNGPIQPGDLLTTSDTPGHAMKVTDHGRAQGAVIGKAMTSLQEGQGLVLVLVSLQ